MVYKWKSPSGIKADPNTAAKQFHELEITIGLTPKNLLEANRGEEAPLHNEFEWDDTIAAESYRVHQAGQLIRMLCIAPEVTTEDSTPIRAYFTTSVSKSYEHIETIIQNADKYADLKKQAFAELSAFRKKYSMLADLDYLMSVINDTIGKE